MMTADELRTFGPRVWGPTYQAHIARGLAVADRTVRRWVAGTSAIPKDAADKIHALADRRAAAQAFAVNKLERLTADAEAAGLDRAEALAALVQRASVLSAIADLAARKPR